MILIACPGTTVTIDGLHLRTDIVRASCIEDGAFNVYNHGALRLSGGLSCNDSFRTHAYIIGRESSLLKIEVKFPSLNLPPQVTYYFNDINKITEFSVYHINANVRGQASCAHPSTFAETSSLYRDLGERLNRLYTKTKQKATINSLLGLNQNSIKYIGSASELYLARGHLASHCDFVFEAQQKATYYYINVAPQWQSFNNGNWKALEMDLRNYVTRYRLDLLIIAGTLGVATLPHERTKTPTGLYLYVSAGKKALPVPKFFWKLAFDEKNRRGAVFIGMNNPFETKIQLLCTDVSSQMRWLSWKKNVRQKGYSYACSISDFRRVVRNLPLTVDATGGLLL